jgi:hypothetical protein
MQGNACALAVARLVAHCALVFELRASWQMHSAELPKPDVLNSMLPGLERDWTEILTSLSNVYYRTASYVVEWDGKCTIIRNHVLNLV